MIIYFARDGQLCYLESESGNFEDNHQSFMEAMKHSELAFVEKGNHFKVIRSRFVQDMTDKIYFDIKYLFLDAECGIIGKVRATPYTLGTFTNN